MSQLDFVAANPGQSQITVSARDAYGGATALSFTMTVTQSETRTIDEHAPAGTAVGAPVTGTPYQEETFSYTLTGEAATSGAFVINASTGQISVKQGAVLDHETKASYTGQVSYTVQGQAATIDLTINVLNVEAGQPGTPTFERTRYESQHAPGLDVSWTAPADNGATITGYAAQYRQQGATEWTAYTGELSADTTSLTLENLQARRHLRGPGARPERRRDRPLVEHRLGAGQPAAAADPSHLCGGDVPGRTELSRRESSELSLHGSRQ